MTTFLGFALAIWACWCIGWFIARIVNGPPAPQEPVEEAAVSRYGEGYSQGYAQGDMDYDNGLQRLPFHVRGADADYDNGFAHGYRDGYDGADYGAGYQP